MFIVGTGGVVGMTAIEGGLIVGGGAGAGDSFMEMVGMSGVTEIAGKLILASRRGEGVSLTHMVGIGGITSIDGIFAEDRLSRGSQTEIDGVSEIEIDGRGAGGGELEREEESWWTSSAGTRGLWD